MPIGRKQSFCDLVWLARHGGQDEEEESYVKSLEEGREAGG